MKPEKQLTLDQLLAFKDPAFEVYSYLSPEELFRFSRTSKKIYNNMGIDYNYLETRILKLIPIPSSFLSEFKAFCEQENITINPNKLLNSLYFHRHYFLSRPLSHFKLLYPFAFEDRFSKEITQKFILNNNKVLSDPYKRNILELAYLVGNETLIKQVFKTKEVLWKYAARGGHVDLAQKANPNLTVKDLLLEATLSGSVFLFNKTKKRLGLTLEQINQYSAEIIDYAVKSNSVEMLQFVLKYFDNNLNYVADNKNNLLHQAIYYHSLEIIVFLLKNNPLLLDQNNNNGSTPLLLAFCACSLSTIQLFFDKNEEEAFKQKIAALRNKYGDSALHHALYNQKYRAEVFEYLLKTNHFELDYQLVHHAAFASLDALLFLEHYSKQHHLFLSKAESENLSKEELTELSARRFQEFLNTFTGSNHIIQALAQDKTLKFEDIKSRIEYLKVICDVDLTTLGEPNNTLIRLFAIKEDVIGMEYCRQQLQQSITSDIIDSIGYKPITLNPNGFFATITVPQLSDQTKEIKNRLKSQTAAKSQFDEKQNLEKKYKAHIEHQYSKLDKMLVILENYQNDLNYLNWFNSNINLIPLYDELKNLSNQNDVDDTMLEKIIFTHLPLIDKEDSKISIVWNCLMSVLYEENENKSTLDFKK